MSIEEVKIRVLLADDHPSLRAGIRARLEQEEDIEVVGEADNGRDALKLARSLEPQLLLLDMEMPEMSGMEVALALKEDGSGIKVLALSAHEDPDYIDRLLSSGGAAGYLTKQESLSTIVAAVRGVAKGEEGWLSREIAALLMKQRRRSAAPKNRLLDELSKREYEVLLLIARGLNNQQIGEELFIAESTVKKHVSNIYSKLEVTTRAEAASWAWQQGLIDKSE